ncbi:MAG: cell division protein CrgA [Acidimicrobiales bacterium]
MAEKRKPKGGRVTAPPSARYTPPVPHEKKVSPRWLPVLMFTLLGLGMICIVANYLNLLPGDDPSNWYLLGGLGLITGGFVVATRLR